MTYLPESGQAPPWFRTWLEQMRGVVDKQDKRIAYLEEILAQTQTELALVKSSSQQVFQQTYDTPYIKSDISSNTTFTTSDLNIFWHLNCTSACTLTLPDPIDGSWIQLYNCGTQTITLNNSAATTIATIQTLRGTRLESVIDSAGAAQWTTKPTVKGLDGLVTEQSPLVIKGEIGILWQAPNGNYFKLAIDDTGAINTFDTATTAEPHEAITAQERS